MQAHCKGYCLMLGGPTRASRNSVSSTNSIICTATRQWSTKALQLMLWQMIQDAVLSMCWYCTPLKLPTMKTEQQHCRAYVLNGRALKLPYSLIRRLKQSCNAYQVETSPQAKTSWIVSACRCIHSKVCANAHLCNEAFQSCKAHSLWLPQAS